MPPKIDIEDETLKTVFYSIRGTINYLHNPLANGERYIRGIIGDIALNSNEMSYLVSKLITESVAASSAEKEDISKNEIKNRLKEIKERVIRQLRAYGKNEVADIIEKNIERDIDNEIHYISTKGVSRYRFMDEKDRKAMEALPYIFTDAILMGESLTRRIMEAEGEFNNLKEFVSMVKKEDIIKGGYNIFRSNRFYSIEETFLKEYDKIKREQDEVYEAVGASIEESIVCEKAAEEEAKNKFKRDLYKNISFDKIFDDLKKRETKENVSLGTTELAEKFLSTLPSPLNSGDKSYREAVNIVAEAIKNPINIIYNKKERESFESMFNIVMVKAYKSEIASKSNLKEINRKIEKLAKELNEGNLLFKENVLSYNGDDEELKRFFNMEFDGAKLKKIKKTDYERFVAAKTRDIVQRANLGISKEIVKDIAPPEAYRAKHNKPREIIEVFKKVVENIERIDIIDDKERESLKNVLKKVENDSISERGYASSIESVRTWLNKYLPIAKKRGNYGEIKGGAFLHAYENWEDGEKLRKLILDTGAQFDETKNRFYLPVEKIDEWNRALGEIIGLDDPNMIKSVIEKREPVPTAEGVFTKSQTIESAIGEMRSLIEEIKREALEEVDKNKKSEEQQKKESKRRIDNVDIDQDMGEPRI